jgi:hypothetical protein
MNRAVENYKNWPQNAPCPIPLSDCEAIIEVVNAMVPAGAKFGTVYATQLLANWPWLDSTKQVLDVYVENVMKIFAAYSIQAGRHVLDPVNGLLGETERPPSLATLNASLRAYDGHRQAALKSAEWLIAESARRAEEVAFDARIEDERKAFQAKHGGKTPLELVRELMGQ